VKVRPACPGEKKDCVSGSCPGVPSEVQRGTLLDGKRRILESAWHFMKMGDTSRDCTRANTVLISQNDSRILRPPSLTPLILEWIQVQRPESSPDFVFSRAWIVQQMVGAHLERSTVSPQSWRGPGDRPAKVSCLSLLSGLSDQGICGSTLSGFRKQLWLHKFK
jgi:hypothetical protein